MRAFFVGMGTGKRRPPLLVFAWLSLIPLALNAEELSLADAIAMAESRSIAARVAENRLLQGFADREAAYSGLWPSLSVDATGLWAASGTSLAGFDGTKPSSNLSVKASQALPGGGTLSLSLSHALSSDLSDLTQPLFLVSPSAGLVWTQPLHTGLSPGSVGNLELEKADLALYRADIRRRQELSALKLETISAYFAVRRLRRESAYDSLALEYHEAKVAAYGELRLAGRLNFSELWAVESDYQSARETAFANASSLVEAEADLSELLGASDPVRELQSGTAEISDFPEMKMSLDEQGLIWDRLILGNTLTKTRESRAAQGIFGLTLQPQYRALSPALRPFDRAWDFFSDEVFWSLSLKAGFTFAAGPSERAKWQDRKSELLVEESSLAVALSQEEHRRAYEKARREWENGKRQLEFYRSETQRAKVRAEEAQVLAGKGLLTPLEVLEARLAALRLGNKVMVLEEYQYRLAAEASMK